MVGHPPQVVKQVYVRSAWLTEVVALGCTYLRTAHLAGFFVGYSGFGFLCNKFVEHWNTTRIAVAPTPAIDYLDTALQTKVFLYFAHNNIPKKTRQ
tara:strand:+ start:244 stop:531 length:288 start_codon:yes stop_codon:yes gene_type:complete